MSLNPIDSNELTSDEVEPGQGTPIANNARSMNKYSGSSQSKHGLHAAANGSSGMHTYGSHAERAAARTKKTNPLVIILIAILAIAAVGTAGYFAYRAFSEGGAASKLEGEATITIPSGYGTGDIIDILYSAGIITDRTAFGKAVAAAGAEGKLQAGMYTIERGASYESIVSTLVAGPIASGITLTIPEGMTVAQTAQRVAETLPITAEQFLAQAKASNYANDYPFLSGAYADSLEGFLFPKTYAIAEGASADQVIRVMLDQFKLETSTIDWSAVSRGNVSLTYYQTIIAASLVEKETAIDDERPLVASVIFNRLNADPQMALQIDAAVAYGIGKYDLLTYDDLQIDTPYNTYLHNGLCPGPIASPSLASIQAVVDAASKPEYQTQHMYYVASSALDGSHVFCNTYEEFEAAKNAYNEAIGVQG